MRPETTTGSYDELLLLCKMQADVIDVVRACSAELNLDALLKLVVEESTKITGATYGAFFHKASQDAEDFNLYTLSGADTADFKSMPPLKTTQFLGPTFTGGNVVRVGNVMRDPRYGKNPHRGPPAGHPPVVSYLAVPVKRNSTIFGALLFAHDNEDHFTDLHEKAVVTIATQVSVALDNVTLYSRAREAVEAREDFLSIAAHEIRNPLTPLQLQIQVLRKEFERAVESQLFTDKRNETLVGRSLDLAHKQVRRLTTLVDELLDVARIRVGKFNLEFETVDLCEMLGDTVERWSQSAAEHGIMMTLPSCHKEEVMADRNRLNQVFTNLIANAIKYAPGGPLQIAIQRTSTDVIVRFTDHGPGIQPEDQERIFNRFERANGEFKRGGLGLGLYLSREIMNAHGGNITVHSMPGKGSTFSVTLPQQPQRTK